MGVGGILLPLLPALHAQSVALDDVGGGLGVLLGVLQRTAGRSDLLPGCFPLGLDRFQLPADGLLSIRHLLPGGVQSRQAFPTLGGGIGGQGLPGLQGADLAAGLAGALRGLAGLFQQGVQLRFQSGSLGIQFLQTPLLGVDLRLGVLTAAVLPLQFLLQLGNGILPVTNIGTQELRLRLLVPGLGGQRVGLLPRPLLLRIVLLHPQGEPVILLIQRVLLRLGLGLPRLCGGIFRLQAVFGGLDLLQPFNPEGDFQRALLIPQQQVTPRRLRLLPQGFHL